MTAHRDDGFDHWREAFRKIRVTNGDEFDLRKFNPSKFGYRPNAVPREVLVSDGENSPIIYSNIHIEGNPWRCALFADGACPGSGSPLARASFGVYGKPDAWYNPGCLLPSTILQTNQSAEIESAIAALYVARAIIKNRWAGKPRPRHVFTAVLIVMDSCYVVKAMTEWIRKWRANGFRNCRGQPVVNMEALQFLDAKVRRLFEDHLVIVQFWQVPRIHNSGADRMAGEALRGNSSWKPMDSDLDSDLDNLTERFARQW